ncbi:MULTISPECIES: ATP-dependent nuclease [unclassified Methanoculleus]|uniref:ATP-dependent nuclease n=1 Tax=unclassified Methanoculleus TaxID=2619537 RepID=UPI0025EAEBF0|nr:MULTISPECIES: AAA family ATPase [unclassified Methanoculleus]MCK9317288.1 AAA family ATPase [Methanoculleus sp.]MDD3932790.1 AAA family ATPase [Methanoculleus sp.]
MYLSELKLWNFRKHGIGGGSIESSPPGLTIQFHEGMNVLIGENDSGKTAIVDAIRYTLGTQSREWIRLDESDFHTESGHRAEELKIECIFRGLTDQEAGRFLEWLGNEDVEGVKRYVLKVSYTARNKGNRIVTDLRAGQDSTGTPIDGDPRALLRTTYLKPLRDADAELTPGRRSRFAQILKAHKLFQKDGTNRHELETIFDEANEAIEGYFKHKEDGSNASELMGLLNSYVRAFFPQNEHYSPSVTVSGSDLFDILQRLSLSLDVNPSGLGAANLLFMATELLLLQSEENFGLKLALIEELEAHLHPQAQIRLIHYLKEKSTTGQYILTTHSTTMGSSIPLENLILCKGSKVFPMGSNYTKLEKKNYDYLDRFLDATKANLFFARGVLLVEGDAENLLIPTIANIVDRPLHRYGVSIVNVGSTAFSHFVGIFHRQDGESMGVKVALITDMDVKPLEYNEITEKKQTEEEIETAKGERKLSVSKFETDDIKVFVSPNWTLEYELALSSQFRADFYRSVLWAEKIANSKNGVPQEGKAEEVQEIVQSDFERWLDTWGDDPRKDEKIAFEIYKKQMLDKEISKAMTAQAFARVLDDKNAVEGAVKSVRSDLKAACTLQYLLDAIYHVTEPREAPNDC